MDINDFVKQRKSKVEVAKELGISNQWLHKFYLKIASQVNDFAFDYPAIGHVHRKRAGLTDYQVWVVTKIMQLTQAGMHSSEMIYDNSYGGTSFNEQLDTALSKANYLDEISIDAEYSAEIIPLNTENTEN
jgi:hypothetical protein